MNMQKLSYRIIALLMPVFAHAGDPAAQLHYDTPATQWNEALPLGNGRLGAMVFGTVEKEGIQFNEDTLWTGGPHDYTRPGGARHLPRVRELVKQRKFKDAQLLGDQHMVGVPKNLQAYQPLGDLALEFANLDGFEDYRRNLDMSTGIARVSYRSGGVQYTREVFASFPDQVIAIGLTCDRPKGLTFTTRLGSPHPHESKAGSPDTLVLTGQVSGHDTAALLGEWKGPGTRFEARIQVAETDGAITTGDGFVSVANARHATLLYTAATAYRNYKDTRSAWGSKWRLNINAPMNYWPAETCNLSECHEPLFGLLNDLREPGRVTAKEVYGCKGFVVHHNTDLWRATAIDDGFYFGGWPMGAAWLSTHLWEHYDFTRDLDFLEGAYPTMREAAEFFVEFLIKDENGYWVTSPSMSFEQSFVTKDEPDGRVCAGPTMDMQILRTLFSDCIVAQSILLFPHKQGDTLPATEYDRQNNKQPA